MSATLTAKSPADLKVADQDRPLSGARHNVPGPREQKPKRFGPAKLILFAAGASIMAGAVYWYVRSTGYESTDDATVEAHVIKVSPKISALVQAVHFDDNRGSVARVVSRTSFKNHPADDCRKELMAHAVTPSGRAINAWWIGLVLTLATFMELLDTSIANVSLPHIAGGLGTSLDEATWVLTSYLVANAVVLPLSAWLSRVFGRKNYYMACVALFTVSSFMCGIAPDLGLLIFFRVLQGIAGGGLAPSKQAMLVDAFPAEKRAAAFGLYSMAIVLAPAIGPTLGGWITDNSSWRWIFFINIPVGLLSVFLTSRLVTDPPAFTEERRRIRASGQGRIDYVGILLLAIGFGCLEVVLDKGQEDDWFGSPFITAFTVISVIALVIAVFWELNYKDPVVDLTLFANRNFAIACLLFFLFGFVLFSTTVLVPQLLQSLDNYDATTAGLVLTPGAIVIVVMAPFIVRLTPIWGAKRLIVIGFCILAASSVFMQGGYSAVEAAGRAQGELYAVLSQQASLLSYLDCFVGLIVPACLGVALAFAIKNFQGPKRPAAAH
jgi:MFS transporter, DHA2 family, multidrug resistance protein